MSRTTDAEHRSPPFDVNSTELEAHVSTIRAVVVGVLAGLGLAVLAYLTLSPSDPAPSPAPSTSVPVPRATTTVPAACPSPSVLQGGVCVTTAPGPTVTVTSGG
ncbi:MAG: hypothetical protein ACRCYR_02085 [Phycicoccus sp.]